MTTLQVLQEKGKRSMWPFCADTSRCFRRVVVEHPKYSDQIFSRFQGNQSFREKQRLCSDANMNSPENRGPGEPGCPSPSLGVRGVLSQVQIRGGIREFPQEAAAAPGGLDLRPSAGLSRRREAPMSDGYGAAGQAQQLRRRSECGGSCEPHQCPPRPVSQSA